MRILIYLIGILFITASCLDDEKYTTSPNDLLTFSKDTISFDTIISGTATNTYKFLVYNKASKAIRIPVVALEKGASSPFRVNVDGTPLNEGTGHDFEIAKGDSMIVYLMANVPDEDNDSPIPTTDKIIFTTEAGISQEVVLKASAQSVHTLTNTRITRDTTFLSARPYRIMDSLVVEKGATLTLNPGTNLYFHPNATLVIHGSLHIAGTMDHPVTLRGDRLGNMFDGQPYDRIPGQWGGIIISGESYDNHINYADIHSGLFGIRVDSSDVNRFKLAIENSIIHNTTHHALETRMANLYVGNSQLTNAGGDCLRVRGGHVTVVHCTIARFFVFTGGSGVAMDFANYDGAVRLPITRLYVANTLITGYQEDEIMGRQNEEHVNDAYEYAFINCLLNTTKPDEDNARIIHCVYDDADDVLDDEGKPVVRERNFLPLPDIGALIFSFKLNPLSRAVGGGDLSIGQETYPYDRLGVPRTTRADIGCYQYVQQPEATAH